MSFLKNRMERSILAVSKSLEQRGETCKGKRLLTAREKTN